MNDEPILLVIDNAVTCRIKVTKDMNDTTFRIHTIYPGSSQQRGFCRLVLFDAIQVKNLRLSANVGEGDLEGIPFLIDQSLHLSGRYCHSQTRSHNVEG